MNTAKKIRWYEKPHMAGMIGNMLEYYDSSLYGFMVPLLSPLFLPTLEPITAWIIGYSLYPLGMLTRPLGAYLIGRIGDKYGRRQALKCSIIGTAITTGLMGCLPTFHSIGIWAPIIFCLLRLSQKFFNGGEYNGGAIFALEHLTHGKGLRSGIYCMFTVFGIFAASAAAWIVSILPTGYWRGAYILAFLTALYGFYLRKRIPETPEFNDLTHEEKLETFSQKFIKHKRVMLCSIGSAGFFAALYMIPTILMISYIPQVTTISSSTILSLNMICMVVYMFALPLGGIIGDKIGYKKSMILATISTIILAYPLFLLIRTNSVFYIFLMKSAFAFLCGWYFGPFHAWVQELFHVNTRYQFISITYSFGSQVGSMMPSVSLWIWHQTAYVEVPAVILILWGLIAIPSIIKSKPPLSITL